MRIAVAGGTGAVGKYVVGAAHQAGHQVVSISRSSGVDVRTGDGLADALTGVDVLIDATNAGTTNRAKAITFFTEEAPAAADSGSGSGRGAPGRVVHRGPGTGSGFRVLRGEVGP